ncbi:MAG: twin-arginine translocase TatA/TatE family subunit [Candidatus Binatia bacterium]
MFGFGATELVIIAVVALLIFGPRKLPELGAALGKGIQGFRKAVKDEGDEARKPPQKLDGPPSN